MRITRLSSRLTSGTPFPGVLFFAHNVIKFVYQCNLFYICEYNILYTTHKNSYTMTHETELRINGIDMQVIVEFEKYETSYPDGTGYRILHITLLETEEEYLESTGGDGTSKEYNEYLDALECGAGYDEAYEKLDTEYEPYGIEDFLNI